MWIIWLSDDVEGLIRPDLFSELDKVTNSCRNRKVYDLLIDNETLLLKYTHRWTDQGLNLSLLNSRNRLRYFMLVHEYLNTKIFSIGYHWVKSF